MRPSYLLATFALLGSLLNVSQSQVGTSNPKILAVLKGHTDTVESVAINPDGTIGASAGFDRTVKLWNLQTNTELTHFAGPQGHTAPILAVRFSPLGDQLATGGSDNTARIWEVPVGSPIASTPLSSEGTRLSLANDGKTLAVGQCDGTVVIFPKGEQKEPLSLKGHSGEIQFIGHAGKTWVTTGTDKTLRYWDEKSKPITNSSMSDYVFTGLAAGSAVYTSSSDDVLRSWVPTPPGVRSLPKTNKPITALVRSHDGNAVAYATGDKKVFVTTIADQKVKTTCIGAKSVPALVVLAPDQAVTVAADAKGLITWWDKNGQLVGERTAPAGEVTSLQFHPQQPLLYSAGVDGTVVGWKLPFDPKHSNEQAIQYTISAHQGKVHALVVHPKSGQLITAGADKFIRVWDLAKAEKPVKEFGPLPNAVTCMALSTNGELLAAGCANDVLLWTLADGKQFAKHTQPTEVRSVSISADQSRLLVGRADNLAALIAVKDGTVFQFVPQLASIPAASFLGTDDSLITVPEETVAVIAPVLVRQATPLAGRLLGFVNPGDPQRLLLLGPGAECSIWNATTGKKERAFTTEGNATAAAISRDQQRIAVADASGSVKLYSLNDGSPIGSFSTDEPIQELTFHPTLPLLLGRTKTRAVVWSVAIPVVKSEFGRIVQSYPHNGGFASVLLTPEGQFLGVGGDQQLRRYRIASPNPVKSIAHPNLVDCVAFDESGKLLATGCHDGVLRVWDIAKSTAVKTINAHVVTSPQQIQHPIYAVLWSPDQKQLFTASFDKTIKIWDVATGNLVREFAAAPAPKPIESKQPEPKKEEATKKDTVDKKDVKPNEAKKEIPKADIPVGPPGHRDQVLTMDLTKDGKHLVTGSSDRTAKLWDVATGRVLRDFANPELKAVFPDEPAPTHSGWVLSVSFSPDEKQLVTVGPAPRGKSYLAVWSVANGERIFGAELDSGAIHSMAMSPDGRRLLLGCAPIKGKTESNVIVVQLPAKP